MRDLATVQVSIVNEITDVYRFELFEQLGKRVDLKVSYYYKTWPARMLILPEESPYNFQHQFLLGRVWSLFFDRHFWKSSVVFIGGYNSLWMWGLFVMCWLTRKRLVMMSDSNDYLEVRKSRWLILFKRVMLFPLVKTMMFLCCGQANRRYWQFYGVSESRLVAAPYAVDSRTFYCHSAHKLTEGRCQFLFVGRLVVAKNLPVLITAFRQLCQVTSGVELVVVGSGVEESRLRQLALGLPVTFVGGQPRDKVVAFVAAADVFVLPSVDEPWGLVVNEAMLMKKPLILSHAVGASEDLLVEGENGFCFDPANVDELVEKMRFFVDNPEKISEFGERSLALVQGFTLDRMIEGYVEAIERCVG